MPRVTTTVLYPAGREPVAVGSTELHRPTISPFGTPASLLANATWHWSRDTNIMAGDVSSGLQTACPGLHDNRTIIAAIAGSICEFLPIVDEISTLESGLCFAVAKISEHVWEQESGYVGSWVCEAKSKIRRRNPVQGRRLCVQTRTHRQSLDMSTRHREMCARRRHQIQTAIKSPDGRPAKSPRTDR